MILLAHPFGNANVRALLDAFAEKGMLGKFLTTLGYSKTSILSLPRPIQRRLGRRAYDLPPGKIEAHPTREAVRLLAGALHLHPLLRHESGWACTDRVWQSLGYFAARHLLEQRRAEKITAVYAYEDCALSLFEAARDLGVRRIYDLPIAYWKTAQRLLKEEAERYPEWEPTLGGTRDSEEKLARKTRELELAELVICPSNFVFESLPESVRNSKPCVVAPFGSPADGSHRSNRSHEQPLRVLFAGALTQRKGLADLFEAVNMLNSKNVELVVMGSLLQPLAWYRERCPNFIYEPPRAHSAVLHLMRSCDLFVLPSIVEGRALVQQEAMACGLPLIATRNAGADDLIHDGETGFLVPIRSPEAIAEKISWCLEHRGSISGMGLAAQTRASELTWRGYGEKVLAAIRSFTGE